MVVVNHLGRSCYLLWENRADIIAITALVLWWVIAEAFLSVANGGAVLTFTVTVYARIPVILLVVSLPLVIQEVKTAYYYPEKVTKREAVAMLLANFGLVVAIIIAFCWILGPGFLLGTAYSSFKASH